MTQKAQETDDEVSIMKTLWGSTEDGRWGINGIKGLTLKPQEGFDLDFFKFESEMELMTNTFSGQSIHDVFASFGSTDFLMKQSIVPVVAWTDDENFVRCIGTAFIISCSGYVMTACHVLLDPKEREYGKVTREGNSLLFGPGLNMGVFMPLNPAYGTKAFMFLPFERCHYWGEWKNSPLIHEQERFDILTDVAICKIPPLPNGVPHQPLNLSLNGFKVGEKGYAFGYAEMDDIPIETRNGERVFRQFEHDLFVSTGEVITVFPENHLKKEVPTPGPCFDFKARIPGKMSGGPIMGAQGAVVRGIVSRSFSGEKHGYGAMLGPMMHLPLGNDGTLDSLMQSGREGITKVQGSGM